MNKKYIAIICLILICIASFTACQKPSAASEQTAVENKQADYKNLANLCERGVKYYPDEVGFQYVRRDKISDETHQDSFVEQECYIFDVLHDGKVVSGIAVGTEDNSLWIRDMNSDKLWLSESFMGLDMDNSEIVKVEPVFNMTGPVTLYFARIDTIPEFSEHNEGFARWDFEENTLTVQAVKNTGTVTGAVDGPSVKAVVMLNEGERELLSVEYRPAPTFSHPSQVLASGEILDIEPDRLIEIAEYFKGLIDELPYS